MDKDIVRKQIQEWVATGIVTKEEIAQMAGESTVSVQSDVGSQVDDGKNTDVSWRSVFSVKYVLYVLGGLILGIGIIAFIAQIWDMLGGAGRVAVTSGAGAFLLLLGFYYTKYGVRILAATFNILGAILFLLGGRVMLGEWFVVTSFSVFVFLLLTSTLFFVLAVVQRSPQLVFFLIASVVLTVYALLITLFEALFLTPHAQSTIVQLTTIILGAAMIYGMVPMQRTFAASVMGVSGFFAINIILAVFWWKIFFDASLWESVFFVVNIGLIAFMVFMNRTWLMVLAVVHLFFYFVYITNSYFADSIGWPLSLMLLGGILLGLGYGSLQIHSHFMKRRASRLKSGGSERA